MLRTKFAKTDYQVMKFCDQALKYRLYVPGWLLSERLVEMRKDPSVDNHQIAICYKDGIPVGVATVFNKKYSKHHVWIFVKKDQRRQGIGKLLVKCLNKNVDFAIEGHFNGAAGSVQFFENIGILETQI